MCRFPALALLLISTISIGAAQNGPNYVGPQEIPSSLVEDSYAIYQQVLPSNAIEWSDAKRTQWLLHDTTTAVPLNVACDSGIGSGLRGGVTPPASRIDEWNEVLADFDDRCHERYKLDGSRFHQVVPVHLLDDAGQKRYRSGVSGFTQPAGHIMQAPPTPDEFKGAEGLHSFSSVYFNRAHTLAAVYFAIGCGSLCGNSTWVVLEKQSDGTWQSLKWVHWGTFS